MNSTIQEYGTVKGLMFGCPSNRISSPIKINKTIPESVLSSLTFSNKDYVRCIVDTLEGRIEGCPTLNEDGSLNVPGVITKRPAGEQNTKGEN